MAMHSTSDRPRGMWMRQPATCWQDAIPCGNGWLGALVYGQIARETILFNHCRLWLGGDHAPLPDISAHLPELRERLSRGEFEAATSVYLTLLDEAGYFNKLQMFHPAFDLAVETELDSPFAEYRRALDFSTGQAEVGWRDGEIAFHRHLFVSRPDDVAVLRLTASRPGAVSARFTLEPHDLAQFQDGRPVQVPIRFDTTAADGDLLIRGQYDDGGEFGGVARITARNGGRRQDGQSLTIDNADEVLVLLKLFVQEPAATAVPRVLAELAALPADYATLFERHVPTHADAFLRLRLDLEAGEADRGKSNEELLLEAYGGDAATALVERLTDYSRYLLVCSSRPGGLPPNLQGLWNGYWEPPWSCMFTNNLNVPMTAWQALPGNLTEAMEPFFDYYEVYEEDYRTNARNLYGCEGFFVPHAQTPATALIRGNASHCVYWTAGAGWLSAFYYDYYLFTGDLDFLRQRALPFMREAARFYEDFITFDKEGQCLFAPSYSPENHPLHRRCTPENLSSFLCTVNATMDVAVARELLTNLCSACELLGVEPEGVARWRRLLTCMPAYEINDDGAASEWIHPDLPDNYRHRHLSHLYPVYPGLEIDPDEDPELAAAFSVALDKRLDVGLAEQCGWAFPHTASARARLAQGDRALKALEMLLQSFVGSNLFTYVADWRRMGVGLDKVTGCIAAFQMDANFGVGAAVLEMLVVSRPGLIKLLPGLPSKWPRGRIAGIRCRGVIEVDLDWDLGEGRMQVTLKSSREQEVTVKFPRTVGSIDTDLPAGDVADGDAGPAFRRLRLPADTEVECRVRF